MKTSTVLYIVMILMHTIHSINITFFDGEWNGIALMASTLLFLIGVVYYSAMYRAHKKHGANHSKARG